MVRLLRSINARLAAVAPKAVKPPKPAPLRDENRPGACRSCGWMVPPMHEACARCCSMNLRTPPDWVTPTVVAEQLAANPGKTWPTPFKRYSVQDELHKFFHKN